jgi:hypothetical protein
MATIDQNLFRPKTKVCRKVTIGEYTIILDVLGHEGAEFHPIVYSVIRVDKFGYRSLEGQLKTKAEAVACFKKTTAFYERFI